MQNLNHKYHLGNTLSKKEQKEGLSQHPLDSPKLAIIAPIFSACESDCVSGRDLNSKHPRTYSPA